MKNTERFSNRVENYVKYRPHYPQAIIPCLEQQAGLTPAAIVADIGAGTGISSLPFLDNGNTVLGVEPNKEMREMAEKLLQRYPNFTAVAGTAERTTLPDASVDLIVAGQSFHWFHQDAARSEFRRIGRKDAHVAMIWNERQTGTDFEKAYDRLIHEYGIDYKDISHRNVGASQLSAFFAPHPYQEHTFLNAQQFDFHGLKGRLLSSSYMPLKDHPSYTSMINRLEELFERYNQHGMVHLHYVTRLYAGRI